MTKEQLMIPRVIVTAYYPNSPYVIGEILIKIDGKENGSRFDLYDSLTQEDCCTYAAEVEKSLSNFHPLEWWEKREIGDMPEYLKDNAVGRI